MIEKLVQHPSFRKRRGPAERTATEARQGEVVLGRTGRWMWIASGALLILAVLALGFWG